MDSGNPIHIRMENEEKRDLKISLFEQNQNSVSLNADDTNILSNVEEGKYGLNFDFKINDRHFESQLSFESADSTDATRIVAKQYVESLQPLKDFLVANFK